MMLAKVFKNDVTVCPHCRSTLRKIAAVINPEKVRRYLRPARPRFRAPCAVGLKASFVQEAT
jgi:hypothetical protein